MKQIFSGMKCNNILSKDLIFSNWLYSKKIDKYYSKITTDDYMFIWFKNDYVIIFQKECKKWIIEPVRNYYHIIKDWIAYEITPKFEMPF